MEALVLGMGVPLASGGWASLPWAPDSPAHHPKVVQSSFWVGDSGAECCAHISFPEAPLGSPTPVGSSPGRDRAPGAP